MLIRGKKLSWIFWHPHQKLWNWDLVKIVKKVLPIPLISYSIVTTIIYIDSILLFFLVVFRRISVTKLRFKTLHIPPDLKVLYFDLGTHRDAVELLWMVNKVLPKITSEYRAIAFEASSTSFLAAKSKISANSHVTIHHIALCNDVPSTGMMRLYKSINSLGDSLYRTSSEYEDVVAGQLSDWFLRPDLSTDSSVCLLRMNIEGAEYDVLQNLINTGCIKKIDGFYGMWDDLSKIDFNLDKKFRNLLKFNSIYPVTFNGRDMDIPFRKWCINFDIVTSVLKGMKRQGIQ